MDDVLRWVSSQNYKDIFQTWQAIITCIAITIGGTYWFFRRRRNRPRINITQEVKHIELSDDKILVRVIVTLTNLGEVLVCITTGLSRLQQIVPLASNSLQEKIINGEDPVENGITLINWPLIQERKLEGDYGRIELEPGEVDEIDFDYILDNEIGVVVAYTSLRNEKNKKHGINWHKSTIYEIQSSFEKNKINSGLVVSNPVKKGTHSNGRTPKTI